MGVGPLSRIVLSGMETARPRRQYVAHSAVALGKDDTPQGDPRFAAEKRKETLKSVKRFAVYTHMNGPLTTRKDSPPWWGFKPLHSSHRANLLRKDPDYYGRFGWTEEPSFIYHWVFLEGEE
jgi:hypothetical protein